MCFTSSLLTPNQPGFILLMSKTFVANRAHQKQVVSSCLWDYFQRSVQCQLTQLVLTGFIMTSITSSKQQTRHVNGQVESDSMSAVMPYMI